jgi:hypothetical protein
MKGTIFPWRIFYASLSSELRNQAPNPQVGTEVPKDPKVAILGCESSQIELTLSA